MYSWVLNARWGTEKDTNNLSFFCHLSLKGKANFARLNSTVNIKI